MDSKILFQYTKEISLRYTLFEKIVYFGYTPTNILAALVLLVFQSKDPKANL